ncbi:heat-shock protein Hsp20 [Halarchaeum grantii]|uniref:Heat-shock protein Hsp20 n=1 Tax=Halarchaeum grantii TaxID=1193105 RepID=A0A830F9K6_9EURY|nr:Hsp20/alpha crystallin family protein [Halarchaeum grantii]GGL32458.1 heat-shock protein Hsp20 [Halarchaeum grantii]
MSDPGTYGAAATRAVLKRVGRAASRLQARTPLAVDVLESDAEYLVVFDAPGAEERDVDVEVSDAAVRVSLDRFRDYREGFETVLPGRALSLDGRAELPRDAIVDPEAARARLNDDGTLYVFVPKAEPVDIRADE